MSAKDLFASVQLVVGSALLIAAAPLLAWASFVYVRGEVPGSCGGDYPPCPPAAESAVGAFIIGLFVCLPVGALLAARRRPEMWCAAIALAFGGLAAGVFSSRFLADPTTTHLAAPLWFCAITATIALVAVVIAVILAGPSQPHAAVDREHPGHSGTEL